ncbi:MAG: hypothetical protein J7K72_02105 [Candidatus Aenigmarchaeota archaeon]|nr:hypothetical protein [Candidatus Aenigmarchaeota archaeon]
MDRKLEDEMKKKMKEGWIRTNMFIEAMAISDTAVESALKKHIDRLEKERGVFVYRKDFKEITEVEKPLPNIPKGYSQIVEIELLTENFEKLVHVVFYYGPSAIEVIEPDKIKIGIGEAQGILNTFAMIIHRFAALGGGGLLVST